MPNTVAMSNAIKYFYRFLATELVDSIKRGTPRKEPLVDTISRLEKELLVPMLAEATQPGVHQEEGTKAIEWRELAQEYRDGMILVLEKLISEKKKDNNFNVSFVELYDVSYYQHQFVNIRTYLEVVRNPDTSLPFSLVSSTKKAEKQPKQEFRLYFPITNDDLAPFLLPCKDVGYQQELVTLDGDRLIDLVGTLVREHVNRVATIDLLYALTDRLASSYQGLVSEQVILNWVKACKRTDGCLADYTYESSLSRWVEILIHAFPQATLSLNTVPLEFVGSLIHELALWNGEFSTKAFVVFQQLDDEERISIFLNFLKGSAAPYERREVQQTGVDFYSSRRELKYSDHQFLSGPQAENVMKLFALLNDRRQLIFTPELAAEFLNVLGEFELIARAAPIIDYIIAQHVELFNTNVQAIVSENEKSFIKFLFLLNKGASYVFAFLEKHPEILAKPAIAAAMLQSQTISKAIILQSMDAKIKDPLLTKLIKVFAQMDQEALKNILKMPTVHNPDYQVVLEHILQNSDVRNKIRTDRDLAIHCVVHNLSQNLSLSLCSQELFSFQEIIYLLKAVRSNEIVHALVNRAKLLLSKNKNNDYISAADRMDIDAMLRIRQSMLDNQKMCLGFQSELIDLITGFYQQEGTVAKLLESHIPEYLDRNGKLVEALLSHLETRQYFKRDLLHNEKRTNQVLPLVLKHISPQIVWKLLENDPGLIDKVRTQVELRKVALSRNFNDKFTISLLATPAVLPEDLCRLLRQPHSELVEKELIKKIGDVQRRIPIILLNELVYEMRLKLPFLQVISNRYEDIDHLNSLFKCESAKNHEVELLLCLVECKTWVPNILNNMNLSDLNRLVVQIIKPEVWIRVVTLLIMPKLQTLFAEQIVNPQEIESTLYYLLNFQSSNEEIVKFKLQMVSGLMTQEKIPHQVWRNLCNDLDDIPLPVQLVLLDCAMGIDPKFAFGKRTLDQERLLQLTAQIKKPKYLTYQLALLKKMVEINQQFDSKTGLGSLQTPIARVTAQHNMGVLKSQLTAVLDQESLEHWIQEQSLENAELKCLLVLAVEKSLITDRVLLAGLFNKKWTFANYSTFLEYNDSDKLKELRLSAPEDNINKSLALMRILLVQIDKSQGAILDIFVKEERECLIRFLGNNVSSSLFKFIEGEVEKLDQRVARSLACHKKCNCEEMLIILKERPNLPMEFYTRLKPDPESNVLEYYLEVFKRDVSIEIQVDVINDVMQRCKVADDIDKLISAFIPPPRSESYQYKDEISGYVARAIGYYQQSASSKQKQLHPLLVAIDETKYLDLEKRLVSVLNGPPFKLLFPSKPNFCARALDQGIKRVYVDAAWANPLLEIDRLFLQNHAKLRRENWIITEKNPYIGMSPVSGQYETLPLPKGEIDEINKICKKAPVPPAPLKSKSTQSPRAMQNN